MDNKLKDSTLALHAGQIPDPTTGARAVPIFQTTSYVFKSAEHAANLFSLKEFGNIYTRLMNPTTDVLEKRIAAIDGGTGALATSSGMAAIFLAITNIAKAGDNIISSASLYGGTDTLFRYTFPRFGIETTFIEDFTPENIKKNIKPNTKVIYAETIGNPKGDVPYFEKIAEIAHEFKIPFFVDNTFAPSICKPFEYGADVIVYSCTKWLGGHGTSIGGVIVDSGKFNWGNGNFPEFTDPDPSYHGLRIWDALSNVPGMGNVAFIIKARIQGMRNIGLCPSPFNSFLILQGIETLPLRMKKHGENAIELAKFLKNHPCVSWVNYTGLEEHKWHQLAKKYLKGSFGSVLGFGIKGGYKAAEKFINSVKIASHLANVGDAKTLVLHPASTSHQQMTEDAQIASGVTPDFIRVSVGLEDIDDIKADFEQALRISQK